MGVIREGSTVITPRVMRGVSAARKGGSTVETALPPHQSQKVIGRIGQAGPLGIAGTQVAGIAVVTPQGMTPPNSMANVIFWITFASLNASPGATGGDIGNVGRN
jgi:hypothetical protein